jgi:DnaJ-like protein
MLALEIIAERRIKEAIERGEFDDLPGAGQPLELDELDPAIPVELRMAYRILRNAGMTVADAQHETAERARARKKLALIAWRSSPRGRRSSP